jgi:hypothetical protein
VSDDPRASLQQIPPASAGAGASPHGGTASPVALEPTPQNPPKKGPTAAQIWLHRAAVLLFVLVCAVIGVLLVILPWSMVWNDNRLLWGYPGLRALLSNGFVRGLCSGLGVLDLWIGFGEAVNYHEEQRTAG